jgi:DNA-binding NtrC family response regulator
MKDRDEITRVEEINTPTEDPICRTDLLQVDPRLGPVALKLAVVSGPEYGKQIALEKGRYRIGKQRDNDLVLSDSAVSRRHLSVEVLRSGCRFRDEDSTNGSFFGGSRFSILEAPVGAVVRIGRTELQVLPVSRALPLPPSERTRFGALVGSSLVMRQAFGLLERAAASDADVLIQGETGTGKELAAEGLHRDGPRAGCPFVICDLAATTPNLIESELFGHVRGAYTGAVSDRAGAFERASSGTLFLDEIGDLSLELQPRLLRALERRQIKRVGGDRYQSVDVRVVAATHKKLDEEVKAGRFRADLFHRLAVVTVVLPPLRERLDDLPLLVAEMLGRAGRSAPKGTILSSETELLLRAYDWPGNVRELRNVIDRAVKMGTDPVVPARRDSRESTPPPKDPDAGLPFMLAKERLVAAFERDYLAALIERSQGNVNLAARESGIAREYLQRLLKKHGLSRA